MSQQITPTQPKYCTTEMLEYLDDLRESGVTNMFGARPYLQDEFPELSKQEASQVLLFWMKTFGDRNK